MSDDVKSVREILECARQLLENTYPGDVGLRQLLYIFEEAEALGAESAPEFDEKILEWSVRGLVLNAERDGHEASALARFARRALAEFPGQVIQVNEYGALRVTEYRNSTPGCGPHLDWRD